MYKLDWDENVDIGCEVSVGSIHFCGHHNPIILGMQVFGDVEDATRFYCTFALNLRTAIDRLPVG